MLFEETSGDLRYIKYGKHELLRRIYVAVRDPNWNTVPVNITIREISIQSDSFLIGYHAEHLNGVIHFSWKGVIVGASDSSLTFTMDGRAQSTFLRNRIGFCILHPMSCAGISCSVQHIDGSMTVSRFPVEIAPHQPFRNIRAIAHEVVPGLQAVVRFSGETFEMEDQRNWTDASYKTYGTPLDLPFPVEIIAGTQLQQSVTLRLVGDVQSIHSAAADQNSLPQFTITSEVAGKLPKLGLSSASHEEPLSEHEIERLRLLRLAHLRIDLHFSHTDWAERLAQAASNARRLNIALEVALHLSDQPETDLSRLREMLDVQQPKMTTWLLFQDKHVCTPDGIAALAKRYLGTYDVHARFAGGTDAFFVQLNRERPSLDGLDLLSYSINPQVHAFDNASLVENLAAQAVTLASARQFSRGRGLIISPVTLKLRYNPAALARPADLLPGQLPAQVDLRQMSLFGAGWTLGSIKSLSEGGAVSVTYYETTGWLGVMECEHRPATMAQVPSTSGEVYPMFHVFTDVGEFAGAEVLRAQSSDPLVIDGLALRLDGKIRVLLTNFTPNMQRIAIHGLRGDVNLHRLDEHNAADALRNPQAFRAQPGERLTPAGDGLHVELAPFALARLDLLTR